MPCPALLAVLRGTIGGSWGGLADLEGVPSSSWGSNRPRSTPSRTSTLCCLQQPHPTSTHTYTSHSTPCRLPTFARLNAHPSICSNCVPAVLPPSPKSHSYHTTFTHTYISHICHCVSIAFLAYSWLPLPGSIRQARPDQGTGTAVAAGSWQGVPTFCAKRTRYHTHHLLAFLHFPLPPFHGCVQLASAAAEASDKQDQLSALPQQMANDAARLAAAESAWPMQHLLKLCACSTTPTPPKHTLHLHTPLRISIHCPRVSFSFSLTAGNRCCGRIRQAGSA